MTTENSGPAPFNPNGGTYTSQQSGSSSYYSGSDILNKPYVAGTTADTTTRGGEHGGPGGGRATPTLKSVAEGYQKFNTFTPEYVSALGLSLYRAGLISNPQSYDQVQTFWNKAVEDAALKYSAGQLVTPEEMIALKLHVSSLATSGGRGGLGGAGGKRTDTSTSISIPSPQDAEALVKNIYQQAVGRDPNKQELARYTSLVVGIAKSSPSTSTSTTSTDASGNSKSSTSTTNRGVTSAGMQQAVMDKLQASPEYGAYQAATTYYNAMLQAIASPVS